MINFDEGGGRLQSLGDCTVKCSVSEAVEEYADRLKLWDRG
jgi:hypothetical protein